MNQLSTAFLIGILIQPLLVDLAICQEHRGNNLTQSTEVIDVISFGEARVGRTRPSAIGIKGYLHVEAKLAGPSCMLIKPIFSIGGTRKENVTRLQVLATGEMPGYLDLDGCADSSIKTQSVLIIPFIIYSWDKTAIIEILYDYKNRVARFTLQKNEIEELSVSIEINRNQQVSD